MRVTVTVISLDTVLEDIKKELKPVVDVEQTDKGFLLKRPCSFLPKQDMDRLFIPFNFQCLEPRKISLYIENSDNWVRDDLIEDARRIFPGFEIPECFPGNHIHSTNPWTVIYQDKYREVDSPKVIVIDTLDKRIQFYTGKTLSGLLVARRHQQYATLLTPREGLVVGLLDWKERPSTWEDLYWWVIHKTGQKIFTMEEFKQEWEKSNFEEIEELNRFDEEMETLKNFEKKK